MEKTQEHRYLEAGNIQEHGVRQPSPRQETRSLWRLKQATDHGAFIIIITANHGPQKKQGFLLAIKQYQWINHDLGHKTDRKVAVKAS